MFAQGQFVGCGLHGFVGWAVVGLGVARLPEAEQQDELRGTPDILVTVPFFDADIFDMEGLIRLGQQVWE